jgi:hypothetical protein
VRVVIKTYNFFGSPKETFSSTTWSHKLHPKLRNCVGLRNERNQSEGKSYVLAGLIKLGRGPLRISIGNCSHE